MRWESDIKNILPLSHRIDQYVEHGHITTIIGINYTHDNSILWLYCWSQSKFIKIRIESPKLTVGCGNRMRTMFLLVVGVAKPVSISSKRHQAGERR